MYRFASLPWHYLFIPYLFQFGQVEVIAAAIVEEYPKQLTRYKELVVLVVCLVLFLLGVSCVTQVINTSVHVI